MPSLTTVAMARSANYSWQCSPLNDYYLEAQPKNNTGYAWAGGRINKDIIFSLFMSISISDLSSDNSGKSLVKFRVFLKGSHPPFENGFKNLDAEFYTNAETVNSQSWGQLFRRFGFQPLANNMSFHSFSGSVKPSALFLKRTSDGLIGSLVVNSDSDSLPILESSAVLTQVFHFKCDNEFKFEVH